MANREMDLTTSEAISWLEAIKDSIHGGDEDYDSRRKAALDIAVTSLKTELENLNTKDENLNSKIENLNDRTDDLISREEALNVIYKYGEQYYPLKVVLDMEEDINNIPSVKPKKGKWIDISPFTCICACCYGVGRNNTSYCPNCGAEMSGGEEDDEKR